MKKKLSGTGNLTLSEDDPWQNLANSIVLCAVDDYIEALQRNDEKAMKSLLIFFYSEWYQMLTTIDPIFLIEGIHSKYGKSCIT